MHFFSSHLNLCITTTICAFFNAILLFRFALCFNMSVPPKLNVSLYTVSCLSWVGYFNRSCLDICICIVSSPCSWACLKYTCQIHCCPKMCYLCVNCIYKFKPCFPLSSPGIRTEQDFYVRLIDSMTKQVGFDLNSSMVCWWHWCILWDDLCVICTKREWMCACVVHPGEFGVTLRCASGARGSLSKYDIFSLGHHLRWLGVCMYLWAYVWREIERERTNWIFGRILWFNLCTYIVLWEQMFVMIIIIGCTNSASCEL